MITAFGESGSGGDPTGAAAHDFDDRNEIALTHGFVVTSELANGRRDVLDHAAIAGSVVSDGEIVIDRFRNADDAKVVALLLSQFRNFVGGVLRIVASDVEKVTDVVGLENLEDALVVALFLQLVTARTESGAGRVTESANLLLRLRREIDQILLQDAEHAIQSAVDFLNAFMVQSLGNNAGDTGVDDSGGAPGLAHQNISYEFSHDRYK